MKVKYKVTLELLVDTEIWSEPSEWDWSGMVDLECDNDEGDVKFVGMEIID